MLEKRDNLITFKFRVRVSNERAGHVMRRTDNRWTTKITMLTQELQKPGQMESQAEGLNKIIFRSRIEYPNTKGGTLEWVYFSCRGLVTDDDDIRLT